LTVDLFVLSVPVRLDRWEYVYLALGGTLASAAAFIFIPDVPTLKRVFVRLLVAGAVTTSTSAWFLRSSIGTVGRINPEHTGLAVSSLSTGYIASSVIVMSIYAMLRETRLRVMAVGVAVIGVSLVPLALSASRGPVVALFVCIAAMLGAQVRLRYPLRVGVVVLLLAGLAPAAVSFVRFSGSNIEARFQRIATWELAESNARMEYWSAAWSQFLRQPLFGSGLEEKTTLMYPHNIVVESFMATGVIGGGAFTLMLIALVVQSLLLLRDRWVFSNAGWIPLLFLHYATMGMFSGAIYTNVMFWVFTVATLRLGEIATRSTAMGSRTVEWRKASGGDSAVA